MTRMRAGTLSSHSEEMSGGVWELIVSSEEEEEGEVDVTIGYVEEE